MKGFFRFTVKNGPELIATREIPFVPAVGSMLAVTHGGDYLSVDDVYWHCEKPDEVVVFLVDKLGEPSANYLLDQGWRME